MYHPKRLYTRCIFPPCNVRYMAAKAVYKERKPVWEGINPNLLARPPRGGGVAMPPRAGVGGAVLLIMVPRNTTKVFLNRSPHCCVYVGVLT